MLVPGFQDVYAVIDCTDAALETNAFYASSKVGTLHKVDPTAVPPTNCLIGTIVAQDGSSATLDVPCEDIAIDHTDEKLYCLGFGTILYRLDRVAVAGTVKAFEIAPITDPTLAMPPVNDLNAFEIDTFGKAYVAVGGTELDAGNFYNLNLVTGVLTLRTAFGNAFVSSGDLARDETTNTDMYWTVLCEGLIDGPDDCGADDTLDRLYKIVLANPSGPDTLVTLPLGVLSKGKVFAIDFVQATQNLCYLTEEGFVFETDRNGVETKAPVLVTPLIPLLEGFGGTGNDVGGTIVMINLMSLALAATQTNAAWLILFAISGAAVIAYQFKGNTKSKNKKINV